MKNPQLFLVVASVVLAGCVGQPTTGGGAGGLVISSLSAEPSQILAGTPTIIEVILKNSGQANAEDVNVQLFGLNTFSSRDDKKTVGDVFGADPALGVTEGAETVAVFTATAPSDLKLTTPYSFVVRARYKYTTDFEGLVRVVTPEYARTSRDTGGMQTSSFTTGPLSLTVRLPSAISSGATKVPIQFEITNVGGGRVYSGSTSSDPSASDLDIISKITAGGELTNCPTTAILGGGKRTIISCELNTGTIAGGFKDIDMTLMLEYNYFVDSAGSVTVTPTGQ